VIERLAGACGSTAHGGAHALRRPSPYRGPRPRQGARGGAAGRHLSTLAFSEGGLRAATLGAGQPARPSRTRSARRQEELDHGGAESTATCGRQALAAERPMTLWLVPRGAKGIVGRGRFDGLGPARQRLGARYRPGVVVGMETCWGADGAGLDIALAAVLPWFLVPSAAVSVGLMETLSLRPVPSHEHEARAPSTDVDTQPVTRADYARMRIATDLQPRFPRRHPHRHRDRPARTPYCECSEVKAAAGEAP